ncbi:DUF262 domain-containing protein [Nostoc sp.]|uniref:DUF262 domain-containing protein n=1 Tax=Nostoc sp. TaxID=1180 RepID=UPI002FFA15F7
MSVAIHAAQKALSSVFSNKFAFSIPAYQRPYAWTKDQATELLTDLLSFLGDGSEAVTDANPYFLGSRDMLSFMLSDGFSRKCYFIFLLLYYIK